MSYTFISLMSPIFEILTEATTSLCASSSYDRCAAPSSHSDCEAYDADTIVDDEHGLDVDMDDVASVKIHDESSEDSYVPDSDTDEDDVSASDDSASIDSKMSNAKRSSAARQNKKKKKKQSNRIIVSKLSSVGVIGNLPTYRGREITHCKFPHCKYQSKTQCQLKMHVKKKHKPVHKINDVTGPFGVGKNLIIICKRCGKLMRDRYSLISHGISVHGRKSDYQCDICLRYFARPYNLTLHKKTLHGFKEPEDCGLDQVQNGKKINDCLYHCEETSCNFSSKYFGNLERHRLTASHLDVVRNRGKKIDKPPTAHACPLCDYKTPPGQFQKGLRRHLYAKHIQKGHKLPKGYDVPLVKCPLCEYTALESSRITRHLKRHAKYGYDLPSGYVAIEVDVPADSD